MLPDIRQYICWRYEQRQGDPKPTKVPFDPRINERIDHLNPHNWMTQQEAAQFAPNYGTGFVITSADPYWCVDLDQVVENGQWKSVVSEVCQYFPEAFCEVSVSGTGLHIWGMGNAPQNHRSKWKFGETKIEFYSKDRFIALGQPLGGTFGKYDYTQCLQQFVPIHQHDASQLTLTDQAAPGYTGPADDDELIRMMLNAPGSAASLFGDRASLVDLWTADVTKLSRFFPSERDDFDRSSADAALCIHLAFWTGKNSARIDRLFRRSGLMRDKWNRPDYIRGTVGKACSMQQKFYNVVREQPTQEQIDAAGDFFLSAEQIKEFFKGHAFIAPMNAVFCPDGRVHKAEVFKNIHGKYSFKLDLSNRKVVKDAFKALTQCEFIDVPVVDGTCFRPDLEPGQILNRHGKLYINSYMPAKVETMEGDVTPFLHHVELMLPDIRDQQILLTYMAALVQYPGVKFQWCPVLQGAPGNGKTTLFRCLEEAIGEHYSYKPKATDLGGRFNSGLKNKLLIGVEEVHISDRREVIDSIKDIITNARIEYEGKGENQSMGDNVSNWFMTTNHRDAIPKTKNDRRFAVFFTAQQNAEDLLRDGMTNAYFNQLTYWLEHQNGFKIVAHYLKNVKLADEFNPAGICNRAPETSSVESAISESRGVVEQEIFEAIASERRGFKGGYIGAGALEQLLKEHRRNIGPRAKSSAMLNLGYTETIRASKPIMEEGDGRVRIYMKPDNPLNGSSAIQVTDAFMAAQGYSGATGMGVATNNIVPFPKPPG